MLNTVWRILVVTGSLGLLYANLVSMGFRYQLSLTILSCAFLGMAEFKAAVLRQPLAGGLLAVGWLALLTLRLFVMNSTPSGALRLVLTFIGLIFIGSALVASWKAR